MYAPEEMLKEVLLGVVTFQLRESVDAVVNLEVMSHVGQDRLASQ
jgi:hypothetical protein